MRKIRLIIAGTVWAAVALLTLDLVVPGLLRNPAQLAPASHNVT